MKPVSNTNNNVSGCVAHRQNFLVCFNEHCSTTPDADAVTFSRSTNSYRQLNDLSNQFAHYFQSKGISSGTMVGICLERDEHLLPAVLGVLKAGASYVPLDPHFPASRLSYMIEDSALLHIITTKQLTAHFTCSDNVALHFIDEEIENIKKGDNSSPNIALAANSLAYTIYTSGSTGKPKGVQIHHGALLNFLGSMQREPGITSKDRLLAITTLSFDISCLELYLPLISGASVVLAPSETARDAEKLISYIYDHGVTMMQATPSTYQMLIDLGWKNSTVTKLLCGGEAMSIDLGNKLQNICNNVWNMYGPTETTVWSSVYRLKGVNDKPILGKPIDQTSLVLLDDKLQMVAPQGEGELYIGGSGLSRGYLNRPDLTSERFINNPFPELNTEKLYKTGDICRYTPDGNIEYIGRSDFQIKIRGFRIELGEIENAILQNTSVKQCVVTAREDMPGFKKLVAYIIESAPAAFSSIAAKDSLKVGLPDYMIPDVFMVVPSFPLTPNGKIDRNALPKPGKGRPELSSQYIQPATEIEKRIAHVFSMLLSIDAIGTDDNFFELGGNSLLGIRACTLLQSEHGIRIPIVKLFEFPTITQLTRYLNQSETSVTAIDRINERATYQRIGRFTDDLLNDGIAIVGMSGRFPGANTIDELWNNLCNNVESISRFTREEAGPGIDQALLDDPDYILARGIIDDADKFDAAFFGISPSEAKLMDPQHRVFLELAYQALENAGYDPDTFAGLIGIYAGAGDNFYYTNNVLYHTDLINMVGKTVVGYGNYKDYIATRASYHLNCTGPGVSMNTGCSTTLLTVDYAFQGLINHECDMALAGGIDICVPQKSGFLYQLNGTFAKDGHCRPFDAEATGTMFCDGAGIVVLKRLKDALHDHDTIYGVIRGSAKNNDGYNKASFLAPSSEGQSQVIAMAQALANVSAADIGYIEAHGTGTPIGDPIEIEGLTKAFRLHTNKNQYCYLSSIKGNIGHPTNAAGIAGLIKATLCLYHEKIPATMHFKTPNPKIDFTQTPFMVTTHLTEWKKSDKPRIAGISSFGFGGTNVHTIVAESPVTAKPSVSARPFHLFPLSAKTEASLNRLTNDFATFFKTHATANLADVSFTLATGRKNHGQRRFIVADTPDAATETCTSLPPDLSGEHYCDVKEKAVCFMFPGQGAQYIGMGKNLYDTEPLYREIVDYCASVINQYLKKDILDILFKEAANTDDEFNSLKNTYYTQPAIFITEYASARLLMSWGIQPSAMIGHSIGEFVCATLSGIFNIDDALRLIALRGRLVSELPHGSMLSIRKNRTVIEPLLPPTIQIATHNSPDLCVVAGPKEAITTFSATLEQQGIICKPLHTSHAFHSAMMDPALENFIAEVEKVPIGTPTIPFLSTLTNEWVNTDNTPDAEYWGRHMRQPVLFSSAISKLLSENKYAFIEIGPRNTLSTLSRQHAEAPGNPVVALLSDTCSNFEECRAVQHALGSLWLHGVSIDWSSYYKGETRYKIPLPLYPFEKSRYWVDPPLAPQAATTLRTIETTPAPQQIAVSPAASSLDTDKIISTLTTAISEVFGRDIAPFGTKTTFIEMGMDSLFLTQVAYKIRETYNVKVTFGYLMKEYPNLRKLSEYIAKTVPPPAPAPVNLAPPLLPQMSQPPGATATTGAPPRSAHGTVLEQVVLEQNQTISKLVSLIEHYGTPSTHTTLRPGTNNAATQADHHPVPDTAATTTEIPPVTPTPSQKGILFSSRLADELSSSYNESATIVFKGKQISRSTLADGIQFLVTRYEALRALFSEDGSTMQIRTKLELHVPFEKVKGTARLEQAIRSEAAAAFDLVHGPLFRAKIIESAKHEFNVVLTAHHTIIDGWSLDVLIMDLCEYCANIRSGRPMSSDPVHSFVDFVRMINNRATSTEYLQMKEFWLQRAATNFPLREFPTDFTRQSVKRFEAGTECLPIPAPLFDKLKQLSRETGCSLYTIILAGLSIFLYRIFSNNNFVLALAMAEQSFLSKNRLVGNCVDLLPFITSIADDTLFTHYLSAVQSDIISIMDNHEYTLVELMRDRSTSDDVNQPVHATVGLTHVKKFDKSELPAIGYDISYQINPKSFENFEVYFIALESPHSLEIKCSYNTTLFASASITKWLGFLENIFNAMVHNSAQALGTLFTLPAEEKERLAQNRSTHQVPPASAVSTDASADPGTTTEKQLFELWRQLLGNKKLDMNSNFFSAGGHSLMAAELFARIERVFGRNLPLSTLYQHPTLRGLARQISSGKSSPDTWKSLVPIQTEGTLPPLFLIHGAEGNVLLYRNLAEHLGKNQPVYGLQSRGLSGTTSFNPEFASTAAMYLEEIREVQPHGPYYLGGYCLGGSIAFEMAQQLSAAGEKTGLVVMFENYNVQAMQWPQPPHLQLTNKVLNIAFHLKNLLSAENSKKLTFFKEKAAVEWSRFKINNRIRIAQLTGKFGKNRGLSYKHLKVDAEFDRALAEYIPQPWEGKVAMFVAHDRFAGHSDPHFGWNGLALGGLDMYKLPIAPHGSLVEPYVKLLAEKLSHALTQAQSELRQQQ